MKNPDIKFNKMSPEDQSNWERYGQYQERQSSMSMTSVGSSYNDDYYDDTIYRRHKEGIDEMPFILKAFCVGFVIVVFLLMIFLMPILPAKPAVIVTEKSTTVLDSASDDAKDKNFIETAIDEKKQQIKAVNEEIKKLNGKKAVADSLKQAKKEVLVVSAVVDDGFMTREIKAQAEVDSVTDHEINMLSKSLESTVDSIAMQIKLNSYIEKQKNAQNNIMSLFSGRRGTNSRLTGIMGL